MNETGETRFDPDRIGEQVESGKLQEEGRVPYPCDPHLGVLHARPDDLRLGERELFRSGIGCLLRREPLPRHVPKTTAEGVVTVGPPARGRESDRRVGDGRVATRRVSRRRG